MQKSQNHTRLLVTCAMLVALEIVLARFCSIQAWNIRIGFSFLALALAGMLYGPIAAGTVGAVADILGANLFPTGPYFPGFTATAFVTGLIYGLFLHKKQNMRSIIPAVLVQQIFCSQLMNTLWISVLYGADFRAMFMTRLVQTAILIPVQIVVLYAASKVLHQVGSRVFAA